MSKRKIMIITPSLSGGGAEKVIKTLISHLNKTKFEIQLVVFNIKEEEFKELDGVRLLNLQTANMKQSLFKILHLIYKYKPEIVYSSLGYISLLLIIFKLFFKKTLFFARESSIVSLSLERQKYPYFYKILYRYLYKYFTKIICQSEYMKIDLHENFNIPLNKMVIINNPVDIENIQILSQEDNQFFNKEKINILAVGRLHKVKGFDHLIKALYLIKDRSYHLTIIGKGSEEQNLLKLTKDYNIEEQISFLGYTENPYSYMQQADILVLSSLSEGFPNVVLEANSCGTPVVAYACPGGVTEIIQNKFNGFLIEDQNIEELAKGIKKSINYTFDNESIRKNIKQKYSVEKIIQKYENIFSNQ